MRGGFSAPAACASTAKARQTLVRRGPVLRQGRAYAELVVQQDTMAPRSQMLPNWVAGRLTEALSRHSYTTARNAKKKKLETTMLADMCSPVVSRMHVTVMPGTATGAVAGKRWK